MPDPNFFAAQAAAVQLVRRTRAVTEPVFARSPQPSSGSGRPSPALLLAGMQEAVDRLNDESFDVAVVGEVKAGKSTLVNGLFFGENLLPVAATPCTAKLAVASFADLKAAEVRFMTRDDWDELISYSQREQDPQLRQDAEATVAAGRALGDDLGGRLGTSRRVDASKLDDYLRAGRRYTPVTSEVRLEWPHRFGKQVRLVDTPGLRDPVRSRAKVTEEYLSRASVVVVTLYAGQPMSRSDYELIKDQLVGAGLDRLVIALNKIDLIDAAHQARVVEHIKTKLKDIEGDLKSAGARMLLEALDKAEVVPVSGQLGLLAVTKGSIPDGDFWEMQFAPRFGFREGDYSAAYAKSGLPELEAAIHRAIGAHEGRDRLAAVHRRVAACLNAASAVVAGELNGSENALKDSSRTLEALRAEQEEIARVKNVFKNSVNQLNERAQVRLAGVRPKREAIESWAHARARQFQSAVAEEVGRIGWGSFDAGVSNANQILAWEARTDRGQRLLSDYAKAVERPLAEVFEELTDRLGAQLPDHVAGDVLMRVRYVRNVDYQPPEGVEAPTISSASFGGAVFRPETTRARMKEELGKVIEKWEVQAVSQLSLALDSTANTIRTAYVGPSIQAISAALTERIEGIERALTERDGGPESAERRRSEELARCQQLKAEQGQIDLILTEIHEAGNNK